MTMLINMAKWLRWMLLSLNKLLLVNKTASLISWCMVIM